MPSLTVVHLGEEGSLVREGHPVLESLGMDQGGYLLKEGQVKPLLPRPLLNKPLSYLSPPPSASKTISVLCHYPLPFPPVIPSSQVGELIRSGEELKVQLSQQ